MPGADFWLDWTLAASVEQLRALLPAILRTDGYAVDELQSAASGPGWATFGLRAPSVAAEPIGVARAQDVHGGGSQMFVGPGPARDDAALAELNRACVLLYVELLRRGAIAPPPPLATPSRPLTAPTA